MKSKDTICPVCGEYYFDFPDDYDICPICGWENDGVQRDQKDYWGGANNLSVNEAKIVHSLLKSKEAGSEISEIIEIYHQRNREIHTLFLNIDHRTAKGEECLKAFAQAHSDFIIELRKLAKTLK